MSEFKVDHRSDHSFYILMVPFVINNFTNQNMSFIYHFSDNKIQNPAFVQLTENKSRLKYLGVKSEPKESMQLNLKNIRSKNECEILKFSFYEMLKNGKVSHRLKGQAKSVNHGYSAKQPHDQLIKNDKINRKQLGIINPESFYNYVNKIQNRQSFQIINRKKRVENKQLDSMAKKMASTKKIQLKCLSDQKKKFLEHKGIALYQTYLKGDKQYTNQSKQMLRYGQSMPYKPDLAQASFAQSERKSTQSLKYYMKTTSLWRGKSEMSALKKDKVSINPWIEDEEYKNLKINRKASSKFGAINHNYQQLCSLFT